MKSRNLSLLCILIAMLLLPGTSYAAAGLSATGTVSGVAVNGKCTFYGILVTPDGTNDVTVKVWGSTAKSGPVLIDTYTVSGSGGPHAVGFAPGVSHVAGASITGVYVSIAVAGGGYCTWKVQYEQ